MNLRDQRSKMTSKQQHYEDGNVSCRYEDLSVIDDEMPLQNKVINKNLKSDYVQGIIEQI